MLACRYGIWGDWEEPYLTLNSDYEAAQLRVFGKMVANGHIYRGRKPVHWSPSSRTALAEAVPSRTKRVLMGVNRHQLRACSICHKRYEGASRATFAA